MEIPIIITSSFLENTLVLKLMSFHLHFEAKISTKNKPVDNREE